MCSGMVGRYVLVTVFRDEAKTLPLVIDSVISQTVRPDHWFLMDDQSVDAGPSMARRFISDFGFASYHRLQQNSDRPYMRYSVGVREGWETFRRMYAAERPQYWGLLDADISPSPEYFATLVAYLDASPNTGTVSGDLTVLLDGVHRIEDPGSALPRGGARLMRVSGLESIGGPPLVPGCDTGIDIKLQNRGWNLARISSVSGKHFRETNSRYGKRRGFQLLGEASYVLRYSPAAVPFVALLGATKSKSLSLAWALTSGFLHAWLASTPRTEDSEVGHYYASALTRFIRSRIGIEKR